MTRKQYLDGEISHYDYYKTLADAAGVGNFNKELLNKVREHGTESIELKVWDQMARFDLQNVWLNSELKRRGDSYSLAGSVCMRKAKAEFEAGVTK